ncbi:murein hydrolase activator EnvC family protein [Gluconobacter morbifer]|uniref:M23ase beta-sheet core domain-containing protein n=1 Tax=Gluconobacter morbifer G707 TaxID=1088869 RepID=G6XLG4_9PROT|nr:peptidoglycan DD-metalloendopeptidase family protein [Gluconobacter morbifer]EHH67219.1 hypothetical protein GMO_22130 [Gluconobacter morbifer G707]
MKASDPFRILPLVLVFSPALGAPHSHHRSRAQVTRPSAGEEALARARAARKALQARQTQEAATLRARQAASNEAERRAREASARAATLGVRTQTVQTALQDTQDRIAGLTAEIAALTARRNAVRQDISRQNAALQPLLPVAVRFSVTPDAALLAAPSSATDSVTALSVMRGFSRLTQRRAASLQARDDELRQLEDTLGKRQQDLDSLRQEQVQEHERDAAQTRIASRHAEMDDATARKAKQAVTEAMRATADLSAEIETLSRQEAAARAALEEEARTLVRRHQIRQAQQAHSQAQALSSGGTGVSSGHGHAPVSGRVMVRWGQETEAGPSTGITYAAASAAGVQAPCAGRVEFSGPFRSFGQMLILDCGHDYRFVLSGLASLGVSSGQNVKKAATLGQMPASDGLLFVQLRHGAQVVSPAPFL